MRNPNRRKIMYYGSSILTKRESITARKCSLARQAENRVVSKVQQILVKDNSFSLKWASN
jgi:hypothetical protein